MANSVPDNQLEFNLGEGEEEATIQLSEEDENQQEEQGEASEQKNQEPPNRAAHGQELDNVSENVQKRISKLTAKMREAERREQAALEYAKNVQAQAHDLQKRLEVTDTSRLTETKSRIDTQAATLKSIIKRAREEGDIDTETEAQERLMQLSLDQRQVAEHLTSRAAQQEEQQEAARQPAKQQQAPVQAKAAPSPRAEEWAGENKWFGKDRAMTYAAFGIHQSLVDEDGFDPESDEYYTELDNRLREEFPQKFKSAGTNNVRQRQSVPAVAPASRSSGVNNARRTVKLSPSQVAIAKKLGVPLEEYAKYVKD